MPLKFRKIQLKSGFIRDFVLYEDENDNYNYENGTFATIHFNWNDKEKTLIISERKGEFPEMLEERTFLIVIVGKGYGVGVTTNEFDKEIKYSGLEVKLKF